MSALTRRTRDLPPAQPEHCRTCLIFPFSWEKTRGASFTQVWQSVFKAMLGETEYFDELSGTSFDSVATVLLVVYLIILTIMMLNLLVAVLSTAHAKVDNNADLEYKVNIKTKAAPYGPNVFISIISTSTRKKRYAARTTRRS